MLAAIGRVNENPEVIVALRYAPFAVCLQVGTLLSFIDRFEAFAGARSERVVRVVASGVTVLLLTLHLTEMGPVSRSNARVQARQSAFDRGCDSGEIRQFTNPDQRFAHEIYAALRQRGLWSADTVNVKPLSR